MDTIDKFIPDFSSYLLGNSKINSGFYTLSIIEEDVKMNANPLICGLLSFFLKNNKNVILLANHESLNHYSLIMKRFSINLLKNERFACIDLFHEPTKDLNKFELPLCENYPNTFNSNRSLNYFTNVRLDDNLELNVTENKISQDIIEQIKAFKNDSQTIVIIDNLSTLPFLEQDLQDFLNSINKTATDIGFHLVALLNKELSGDETSNYIRNLSDIEMRVKHNESGYSKDVDGQIIFQYNFMTSRREWNLRFNVKENTINFFPHLVI